MKHKTVFLMIALFIAISFKAFAQGENPQECTPTDCNGKRIQWVEFTKTIQIPGFEGCDVTVNLRYAYCGSKYYLFIDSYDLNDDGSCDKLKDRINPSNTGFDEEFYKWFFKQCFYYTCLSMAMDQFIDDPSSIVCPNAYTDFEGIYGSCAATFFQKTINPKTHQTVYKYIEVPCTGSICCNVACSICYDQKTGAMTVTDKTTAPTGACSGLKPKYIPANSTLLGGCFPKCDSKYGFNSSAPAPKN